MRRGSEVSPSQSPRTELDGSASEPPEPGPCVGLPGARERAPHRSRNRKLYQVQDRLSVPLVVGIFFFF